MSLESLPPHILSQIQTAISELPSVSHSEIAAGSQDACPICLQDFAAILQHEPLQVTKIAACSHLFCKPDLAEWIRNLHGSCPTCRHPFLEMGPFPEDDESSDGGEYVPVDVDFEEDEPFDDSFLASEPDLDHEQEDLDFDIQRYIIDGHFSPTSVSVHSDMSDWDVNASSSMDEDESPATPSEIDYDADMTSSVADADEVAEAIQFEMGGFHDDSPLDSLPSQEEERK